MYRHRLCKALVLAGLVGLSASAYRIAAADDTLPQPLVENTIPDLVKWHLRLPHDLHLTYRGVVSFDEAGLGSGAFLYPAPSAVGMLIEVLAHGLIVDASKDEQKHKLQLAADKVLTPYTAVLDKFDYRDLMSRAARKLSPGIAMELTDTTEKPVPVASLESAPVFSMTQDQTAIILDNTVLIHMHDGTPALLEKIRVVSNVLQADDPTDHWMSSNGERLKDESAGLVAESLEIAFRTPDAGADSAPYKTLRYREGGAEKIERAQLLSTHCERMLIRTLRGALMSVPVSRRAGQIPDTGLRCSGVAGIDQNTVNR